MIMEISLEKIECEWNLTSIEKLEQEWLVDSKIDQSELGKELENSFRLHAKYHKFYSKERRALEKIHTMYKKTFATIREYYLGDLVDETAFKKFNLKPFPKRILKSEVSTYLDADPILCSILLTLNEQQIKVDFLLSVLKILQTRGYNIKSIIDWKKLVDFGVA